MSIATSQANNLKFHHRRHHAPRYVSLFTYFLRNIIQISKQIELAKERDFHLNMYIYEEKSLETHEFISYTEHDDDDGKPL